MEMVKFNKTYLDWISDFEKGENTRPAVLLGRIFNSAHVCLRNRPLETEEKSKYALKCSLNVIFP